MYYIALRIRAVVGDVCNIYIYESYYKNKIALECKIYLVVYLDQNFHIMSPIHFLINREL